MTFSIGLKKPFFLASFAYPVKTFFDGLWLQILPRRMSEIVGWLKPVSFAICDCVIPEATNNLVMSESVI